MITEKPEAENNQKLASYNDFLRELAKDRGYLVADLNADMQEGVKQGARFTTDGVHMAFTGNKMMASGILRAFGVPDDSITASNARWDDISGTVRMNILMSENQRKALAEAASIHAVEEVQFVINWRDDITTAHVIRYRGADYDITRVDPFEGYKSDITVYCKKRA